MRQGKRYGLLVRGWLWAGLLLGLAACSFPFNYPVNVLDHDDLSGTFTVGQGGINPNPKTVGPVEIRYTPDPRVNLTGATLDYKVCFTSETPGASFQGSLSYTAYLGGEEETLFQDANKLAEGTKEVSALSTGPVCVEGQAQATAAQVQALQSGTFYVGARISGDATSAQGATVRYQTERFLLRLSGTVRP
ncbi:uncharacterized protein TTMY_0856 [Thermus thermophilus]|uniref:hypothetical protein n=1 Tax=Thermus thermophilus TaxID=274 RepID=UPI00090B9A3A|nr:hypothetical protein [Thermus thermophilus]BAW01260.1 uncharacterized protein TTMY_0856 [Thermus thermophilus]BDB11912.1 hypothetical protein TthTMY_16510 [Thermus thermophilus]